MTARPIRHARVPGHHPNRGFLPADMLAHAARRLGAFATMVEGLALAVLPLRLGRAGPDFLTAFRVATLAVILLASAIIAYVG